MNKFEREKLEETLNEIQEIWEADPDVHKSRRHQNKPGIRSSQTSALVAFLIKKGIIK